MTISDLDPNAIASMILFFRNYYQLLDHKRPLKIENKTVTLREKQKDVQFWRSFNFWTILLNNRHGKEDQEEAARIGRAHRGAIIVARQHSWIRIIIFYPHT